MKRKLLAVITLGLCLLVGCSSNATTEKQFREIAEAEPTETEFEPSYYPLLMQVTEIETETDLITAVDSYGSSWQFISDDTQIGELYSCIMYDNGTEEVEDDEIVKMRASGNVLDYATESVVGYDVTESGVLLHFENGTGYYLEN